MGNTPSAQEKKKSPVTEPKVKKAVPTGPTIDQALLNVTIDSRTIQLTGFKLEALPQKVMASKQLSQLFLYHNNFSFLPVQQMMTFNFLHSIDFSFNDITSIPPEISQIPKLKSLVLVGNCISELPTTISLLTKLESIKMSMNELSSFPDFLLALPNLTDLQLARNKIASWEVADGTNAIAPITHLGLEDNMLVEVPDRIGVLTTLKTLKLSSNKIKKVSRQIGKLGSVQSLDLRDNQIVDVPHDIIAMSDLRTLALQDNEIVDLPSSWFPPNGSSSPRKSESGPSVFNNLEDLYLHHNKIKELSENFFDAFPRLVVLDLVNNELASFPFPSRSSSSRKIHYLIQLEVGYNKLDNFSGVSSLPELSRLSLFGNKIEQLPSLVTMNNLRNLSLSYNPLGKIPELPNTIEDLHIAGCNLTECPPALSSLNNLVRLHMANNKIENLSIKIENFKSLSILDVENNKIKEVPEAIRKRFSDTSKMILHIDGNPLDQSILSAHQFHKPLHYNPSKRFKIGYSDMLGRRPTMEDALVIHGSFEGDDKCDLIGLLDGHGGSEVAVFAGSQFATVLASKFDKHNPEESLRATFDLVNNGCLSGVEKAATKRVGATALVGLFLKDKLYIANVGDTRAVVSKAGKAQRVSTDHKPLMDEERVRIHKLGGFVLENGRVNGILAVARSFGDFYLTPFISVEPDMQTIDITPDMQFVIFACDGCWDVLSDEVAVEIVQKSLEEHNDPYIAASTLRDFAYLAGSGDNISTIIIQLNSK